MNPVDTHFHWYPRALFEALADRPGSPRAERVDDGYRLWINDGQSFIPLPAVWFDLDRGLAASRVAAGADTAVVCTAGVFSGVLDQMKLDDAVELAESLNTALAEAQASLPGVFYGTASIPLQDTAVALRLLDRAIGELDLRGVNLPPVTADGPIDAERLAPFYARVAELGVPLIVHPTDLAFATQLTGYEDALQRTIGRPFDSSITVLRLVFSGLLAAHPTLRVVHTHAGAYIPSQAGRIDKNARIKDLPEPPSAYLRRIYTDTVAPRAAGSIRAALDFYGAGHVLYGTDYPCWSPRDAVELIGSLGLADVDHRRLMATNAREAFPLH